MCFLKTHNALLNSRKSGSFWKQPSSLTSHSKHYAIRIKTIYYFTDRNVGIYIVTDYKTLIENPEGESSVQHMAELQQTEDSR